MTYKVWQVRCSVCFLGWGWSPVYSKKQGTDGGRRQSLWKSSKENPVKMCYNTIIHHRNGGNEYGEIERKWLVSGWPQGLPLREEFRMRQGYISVHPTVRIREEALTGGDTQYILCFKSAGTLAREEIERPIDQELFRQLEQKIDCQAADRQAAPQLCPGRNPLAGSEPGESKGSLQSFGMPRWSLTRWRMP